MPCPAQMQDIADNLLIHVLRSLTHHISEPLWAGRAESSSPTGHALATALLIHLANRPALIPNEIQRSILDGGLSVEELSAAVANVGAERLNISILLALLQQWSLRHSQAHLSAMAVRFAPLLLPEACCGDEGRGPAAVTALVVNAIDILSASLGVALPKAMKAAAATCSAGPNTSHGITNSLKTTDAEAPVFRCVSRAQVLSPDLCSSACMAGPGCAALGPAHNAQEDCLQPSSSSQCPVGDNSCAGDSNLDAPGFQCVLSQLLHQTVSPLLFQDDAEQLAEHSVYHAQHSPCALAADHKSSPGTTTTATTSLAPPTLPHELANEKEEVVCFVHVDTGPDQRLTCKQSLVDALPTALAPAPAQHTLKATGTEMAGLLAAWNRVGIRTKAQPRAGAASNLLSRLSCSFSALSS
ncbi:hypothetical protein V8C86DRAFT_2828953 [Haematococcus lacustris]